MPGSGGRSRSPEFRHDRCGRIHALGTAILSWVLGSLVRESFPDLAVEMAIAPGTLIAAALAGVVALAPAPVVTLRRLRLMDVPSTLRVME